MLCRFWLLSLLPLPFLFGCGYHTLGSAAHVPSTVHTLSVPYFDNRNTAYPSIRVRMDFRDPGIVGTFLYHCHLLEHEDGGMMGSIRVEPASP